MIPQDDINTLWKIYKANPRKQDVKEKILLNYIPLVRMIAGRMMISLPNSISLDDLVSNGLLGLINAVEKFDLNKNIKFETYANIKVRGAILDGLREIDWMPRGLRDKNKLLENAIKKAEVKVGRIPTDIEIAEELKMPIEDYYNLLSDVKVVTLLSLDNQIENGDNDQKVIDTIEDKETKTPAEIVEREELKKILVKSIKSLKSTERNVIALYYYEQLTLREIGEVMNLTESRVSQIHTKVILALRNKIKEYLISE